MCKLLTAKNFAAQLSVVESLRS